MFAWNAVHKGNCNSIILKTIGHLSAMSIYIQGLLHNGIQDFTQRLKASDPRLPLWRQTGEIHHADEVKSRICVYPDGFEPIRNGSMHWASSKIINSDSCNEVDLGNLRKIVYVMHYGRDIRRDFYMQNKHREHVYTYNGQQKIFNNWTHRCTEISFAIQTFLRKCLRRHCLRNNLTF